ncbi:MAG: phosphorylase family protein, partial [Nitrospirota bacterium]
MMLIVFATESEAEPFLEGGGWERENSGHKLLFRQHAADKTPTASVLISGMGQVNTAQALTAFFESRTRPDFLIMGGCAGAFRGKGITAGDVCFATEEIYADTGVCSTEGFSGLEATGI